MDALKDAPSESPLRYRCFALLRPNGGWSRWRFAPDRGQTYKQLLHNAGRDVLFASVQHFPPPVGMAGFLKWGEVGEQYKNENALPHIAPLYFDIDCADGLDDALTLAHGLYEFFNGELGIAPEHVRVWFSGSKGAHLLVHPEALGIEPSSARFPVMSAGSMATARFSWPRSWSRRKHCKNTWSLSTRT